MTDATTFFLSFLAIFGGIGAYLWRLERKIDALAEATNPKKKA